MAIDINLKHDLDEMDEKYGDQMYKIFGPTLLGFPQDADSSRLYMFTSHIKQVLNLLDPDIPRIQTGFENTIGKYNRAYKKMEGKWQVVAKIPKFRNGQIYTLIFYNKKTDTYDMIEKVVAEDLTEKFGFIYNTNKMDSLDVGDVIEDDVVYKSTSYDDNMNYRYGKNAKVYYSTSNDTLEDAVVIRKSWADNVKTVETDIVQVAINDNDILLNLYGDDEVYKTFPDIGERVINSTLCATRRINKNHLLYDFQSQNMREIYNTDIDYFVSKDSVIYDIDIYYNNDDPFPTNLFYGQLKTYYDDICNYADKLYEWATKIKNSGSKYTNNVSVFRSRYKNFNNPDYKWKNKDKVFNNLIVEFKVKSIVSLDSGSKLTGRYGDKGVVSTIINDVKDGLYDGLLTAMGKENTEEEREKLASNISIVDDEKMPYTDDFPVDIILNMSGAIRRLNTGQIFEVELTFIANEIRKKICALKTLEEKEEMVFKFLSMVNEDQYEFFHALYQSYDKRIDVHGKTIRLMSQDSKEAFIKDIETNGFYLVKPPHVCIRYESIKRLYDEFDFIKPLPLYINLFGTRKRRIIKDGIVGDKYMIVLKQNSNKNFSARSTFRVNRANLPAKDITKKTNRSSYAKSPIRLSEIYNLMSSISGADLAEYNIFMRSSTLGRKSLDQILASDGNPLAIKHLKLKDNFINANADILNARLKAIGLKIDFLNSKDEIDDVMIDAVAPLYIDRYIIYDSPVNKAMYNRLFVLYKQYLRSQSIIETYPGEKHDIAWNYVFNLDEVKEMNITDDTKELLIRTTKGNANIDENDDKNNKQDNDIVEVNKEIVENPPVEKKKRGRKKKVKMVE